MNENENERRKLRPNQVVPPKVALFLLLCCCGLLIACGGGSPGASQRNSGASQQFDFFRIVDAEDNPVTIQYAYAPSIVFKDNVYHVFFCSGGNISPAWDYVRYVKSTDGGKTWSTPIDMLHGNTELGACDPSVVSYQGFYYMSFSSAYSTAPNVYQTIIQVARSVNIDGPYLTYTQRGTWEDTPSDPQTIIYPLIKQTQNPSGYGAGQQTVVAHDGKLLMWYCDDSQSPQEITTGFNGFKIFMLQSTDPVSWTPAAGNATNVDGVDPVDVKYDAAINQFVMTHVGPAFTSRETLTRYYSSDRMTWGPTQTVIGPADFPPYAHNVGVAGDEQGSTLTTSTLVAFGASLGLADRLTLNHYDLYGVFVDPP